MLILIAPHTVINMDHVISVSLRAGSKAEAQVVISLPPSDAGGSNDISVRADTPTGKAVAWWFVHANRGEIEDANWGSTVDVLSAHMNHLAGYHAAIKLPAILADDPEGS